MRGSTGAAKNSCEYYTYSVVTQSCYSMDVSEIDKIEQIDVYSKCYDASTCHNISRKAAMLEFHIITQRNAIVKNFDAVLYLYRHVGECRLC